MKLKVLDMDDTPAACQRRAVAYREEYCHDWIRNEYDHTFLLWSNSRDDPSDKVYDEARKKMVDVACPFEKVLDDDGCATGEYKEKDGLIVIPVDWFKHSGTVYFIRGEAPTGCCCRWDSTCFHDTAPLYLYVDQARWEKYCGKGAWEFKDGKPTEKLRLAAYEAARGEIHEMNLCSSGEYYGCRVEDRAGDEWVEDYCSGGTLTDTPAKDLDFELGIPLVAKYDTYLVGDTFDQECWAMSDDITGKFIKFKRDDAYELVDDPVDASLYVKSYLTNNRKHWEDTFKRALTVVDVTERVWAHYPECWAEGGV